MSCFLKKSEEISAKKNTSSQEKSMFDVSEKKTSLTSLRKKKQCFMFSQEICFLWDFVLASIFFETNRIVWSVEKKGKYSKPYFISLRFLSVFFPIRRKNSQKSFFERNWLYFVENSVRFRSRSAFCHNFKLLLLQSFSSQKKVQVGCFLSANLFL